MSDQSHTAIPSVALAGSHAAHVRPALRAAAWVLLAGGLIGFAGVSRPIVGEWADASGHPDQQVAIALSDPGQFRLGFAGMGVGYLLMGVALVLWGRGVARLRWGRWARLAVAAGTVAGVGGAVLCLDHVLAPLADLEHAAAGNNFYNAVEVIGSVGLTLGFVLFGIANWRGPAPTWSGIVLALSGLASLILFPAFYIFGALLVGLFLGFWLRRSWQPKVR